MEPVIKPVEMVYICITVSPLINVHALISENQLFKAWLQKYSCSFISACTYIRIQRACTYIRKLLRTLRENCSVI